MPVCVRAEVGEQYLRREKAFLGSHKIIFLVLVSTVVIIVTIIIIIKITIIREWAVMGPGFLNIVIYGVSTTTLHNYAEEHIKPRIQLDTTCKY